MKKKVLLKEKFNFKLIAYVGEKLKSQILFKKRIKKVLHDFVTMFNFLYFQTLTDCER